MLSIYNWVKYCQYIGNVSVNKHGEFLPPFLFIQEQIIEFWQEVMDALGPNIKIAVGKGDIRVEEDVRVEDVKESKPMATVFWHLGT